MYTPSRGFTFLSVIVLVLSVLSLEVIANPGNNHNADHPHLHLKQSSGPPLSRKSGSIFPQLTWLRDTAIERVFGKHPNSKACHDKKSDAEKSSQLPATLLAKYGGDVVLRFNISTAEEEEALSEAADTLFLDVWEFTNNWADIRLREDDVASLLGLLPKSLHMSYSNLMPNLARTIYQSYPSITWSQPTLSGAHVDSSFSPRLRVARDGVDNVFFKEYQPVSVIVPWMRLMASMFPSHVQMISIGLTYEGRDIHALRIGVHPTNNREDPKPRQTILISGGSHAREWISVSTVTYMAWSLITSYGKSPTITKLIQEFDWVFIPTLNSDGYIYTWESDRLWRKNRQQTSLRFCRGLDLDRGFGFAWDGTTYQSNPCSESYPGDAPFQAVESHRLAEWAKNETTNNNVRFIGFLDMHSYSQQVLYPYSYTCETSPPTAENLEELGMGLAKAIRLSSGEYYEVQSACEGAVPFASRTSSKDNMHARMETGGGSAIDWFYHELGVRYSYQIKLRDTGSYGFLLPSENIIPTGDEAFNALKYFGDFLLGNKGIETMLEEEKAMADLEHGVADAGIVEEEKSVVDNDRNEHTPELVHAAEIENDFLELRRRMRR